MVTGISIFVNETLGNPCICHYYSNNIGNFNWYYLQCFAWCCSTKLCLLLHFAVLCLMPEHEQISKEWISVYGELCHVLGMAYVLAHESISLVLVQVFSDPKALRIR